MQIPNKKLKNGFEMPVFGLGTWYIGGAKSHNMDNDDESDIKAIQNAINNGITHIDTAEVYAGGYAETLIGKSIKNYNRSALFITSKVSYDMSYNGILNACKKSLERLETNYLDLYLLHNYNPDFPLSEQAKALDFLVKEGLVKNIGVCNFGKENLAEIQSYTKNKIVCNQVHYNLIFREPESKGLLQYCQQNDILLSAWRPTQKGMLSSNVNDFVMKLCDKYNKTPIQIAINWLISQDNVITLSKTSKEEHLKENLGAIGWCMEKNDIELLREEYPDQKEISDAVPLDAVIR